MKATDFRTLSILSAPQVTARLSDKFIGPHWPSSWHCLIGQWLLRLLEDPDLHCSSDEIYHNAPRT